MNYMAFLLFPEKNMLDRSKLDPYSEYKVNIRVDHEQKPLSVLIVNYLLYLLIFIDMLTDCCLECNIHFLRLVKGVTGDLVLILKAHVPKHYHSVNMFILITSLWRTQRRADSHPDWQKASVLTSDKIILKHVRLFTGKKIAPGGK